MNRSYNGLSWIPPPSLLPLPKLLPASLLPKLRPADNSLLPSKREREMEREEEEEEEEESLFKADAVNEEDSERDRATQV